MELNSNGTIIALTTYVDGHEDGPSLEWYPDGNLKEEGLVRRYKPVGTWRNLHQNGRLAREEQVSNEGDVVVRRRWKEEGGRIENRDVANVWEGRGPRARRPGRE